jgi:hypothetical protein
MWLADEKREVCILNHAHASLFHLQLIHILSPSKTSQAGENVLSSDGVPLSA